MNPSTSLDLPPLFRAVILREHRDAFTHAKAIAAEAGAGTIVWVRRFDSIEFAVVLEPDEPLATARRAIYPVMNAVGDALAGQCPPEKEMGFTWPDTIVLDRAIIGGVQLGWPDGASEDDPADWLVAGVTLRTAIALTAPMGANASPYDVVGTRGTSLELEGFELIDAASIIESFARHLMLYVDQWQAIGFKPVAERFLGWLPERKGVRRGIDGNGDLLVRDLKVPGTPAREALVPALATPQWLDPETGQIWL